MKKQLSRQIITCILVAVSITAISQSKEEKKYKEQANAIRAEVWGWKKPEFAVRDIPAQYAGTSKVIIARHSEIIADSKTKTNLSVAGLAAYPQLNVTEITREAIKINDKVAVKDYSEISYAKFEKYARGYRRAVSNTFIGIRIIKPDGTVKEINEDDNVLTKDEKTSQEAKVAIPDLEVGDIVDYFIARQQKIDQQNPTDVFSNLFLLFDDAPVMFYSIHLETGKKYAIEYRCYNGAPDFKRSKTEDEDNVFDMLIKNIPAYTDGSLWISPLRQLPLIRMNIKVGRTAYSGTTYKREPGKVYANPSPSDWLNEMRNAVDYSGSELTSYYISNNLPDDMVDRYADLVKKKDKLPEDSVIAELYYTFRYWWFLDVSANDRIDAVVNGTNSNRIPGSPLWSFRSLLKEKKRSFNVLFTAPRSGPRLKELFDFSDVGFMLTINRVKGEHRLMGISDMFSPAFYVPDEVENTNGAMPASETSNEEYSSVQSDKFPGSSASQNRWVETIDLTPADNGADLQVTRRTVLQGHYKEDIQKRLILVEDYINSERKLLGAENTITEQLADAKKKKRSYAPELQAAFDKARSKQKDNFISEAKSWFDQPITNMTDYKVENLGVRHTDPDFIYSSKFNLEGAIKKAGNNMIIDIGKLEGSQLKISADQRKRKLDIYQSFARSLQWTITLQIPEGYSADGINELNRKVENETGYFNVEASSDGKTVTINVKKSYNHAYEPVANWEKMLAFIDAANEWNNAKILLKKK